MKSEFPVPVQASATITEWATELARRAGVSSQTFLATPERFMSYPLSSVRVELMDGSFVEFRSAFALVSEAKRAVGVFSEHCGSFVVPYHEARVYEDGKLTYAQGEA